MYVYSAYYVMMLQRITRTDSFFDNFSVSRCTHASQQLGCHEWERNEAQPNRRKFTNHAILSGVNLLSHLR